MIETQGVQSDRRREEGEFWTAFHKVRPRLFGALLDALARTLNALPAVRPTQLQRMADFTRIGAAVSMALGYGQ